MYILAHLYFLYIVILKSVIVWISHTYIYAKDYKNVHTSLENTVLSLAMAVASGNSDSPRGCWLWPWPGNVSAADVLDCWSDQILLLVDCCWGVKSSAADDWLLKPLATAWKQQKTILLQFSRRFLFLFKLGF